MHLWLESTYSLKIIFLNFSYTSHLIPLIYLTLYLANKSLLGNKIIKLFKSWIIYLRNWKVQWQTRWDDISRCAILVAFVFLNSVVFDCWIIYSTRVTIFCYNLWSLQLWIHLSVHYASQYGKMTDIDKLLLRVHVIRRCTHPHTNTHTHTYGCMYLCYFKFISTMYESILE